MMMILSPIGVIKSAGFESDFHYYDVTDLLFMVIPYFSRAACLSACSAQCSGIVTKAWETLNMYIAFHPLGRKVLKLSI